MAFEIGETVLSKGQLARVVKVHYDDPPDPYYTVRMEEGGTERQTSEMRMAHQSQLAAAVALREAARVGSDARLDRLLHIPAVLGEISSLDMKGRSVIWLAARYGHTSCLRLLLRATSDAKLVNMPDRCSGATPLLAAVAAGQKDGVALLLADTRVDVNATICEGVNSGEEPSEEQSSSDDEISEDDSPHSALTSAVCNGHHEIVTLLLKCKRLDRSPARMADVRSAARKMGGGRKMKLAKLCTPKYSYAVSTWLIASSGVALVAVAAIEEPGRGVSVIPVVLTAFVFSVIFALATGS